MELGHKELLYQPALRPAAFAAFARSIVNKKHFLVYRFDEAACKLVQDDTLEPAGIESFLAAGDKELTFAIEDSGKPWHLLGFRRARSHQWICDSIHLRQLLKSAHPEKVLSSGVSGISTVQARLYFVLSTYIPARSPQSEPERATMRCCGQREYSGFIDYAYKYILDSQ